MVGTKSRKFHWLTNLPLQIMALSSQPNEILDRIASAIDGVTDLQNLGAACKRLYAVVTPRHTEYRVIRAPLNSSIWEWLAKNRSLAQNVRILDLGNYSRPGCPVIPASFRRDPHAGTNENGVQENSAPFHICVLRNMPFIICALRNMDRLTNFRWGCNYHSPEYVNDIWVMLNKCPSLREVDLLDVPGEHHIQFPSVFMLSNLTSLSLVLNVSTAAHANSPTVELIIDMLLLKNRDLQLLKLRLNPPWDVSYHQSTNADITRFFAAGHWPSLRVLELSGCYASGSAVSSFLWSHPRLAELHLRSGMASVGFEDETLTLRNGTAPALRVLDVPLEMALAILRCPVPTPRPIEAIRQFTVDDASLQVLCDSGVGSTLRKLYIDSVSSTSTWSQLGRFAPGIEWLQFVKNLTWEHECEEDVYSALACFPRLTTLGGVGLMDAGNSRAKNEERICKVASACPSLRRLDWRVNSRTWWDAAVFIERRGGQVSWSVKDITNRS